MKTIFKLVFVLFALLSLSSCGTDNDPGIKSVYYNSWGDGLDTLKVYGEGFHGHAPWAEHIQYNSRNQTLTYQSEVMDKNGTEITIVANVSFAIVSNKMAQLHLKWGEDYAKAFINKKAYGAIKDVAGRYTYEELYSTKREALESEIESILTEDFEGNYVSLDFVEVADVNLPRPIANQIIAKEEQKQRNLKAELMEAEKSFTAKANIAEAEGKKQSEILKAEGEAQAIEIKNRALAQSPKYIDLIKAEAQMELSKNIKGLGTGNVFGSETLIMKTLNGAK